jgi:hypothetical protein
MADMICHKVYELLMSIFSIIKENSSSRLSGLEPVALIAKLTVKILPYR